MIPTCQSQCGLDDAAENNTLGECLAEIKEYYKRR